eukprot:6400041-Amphidinium_carterae.1
MQPTATGKRAERTETLRMQLLRRDIIAELYMLLRDVIATDFHVFVQEHRCNKIDAAIIAMTLLRALKEISAIPSTLALRSRVSGCVNRYQTSAC